MFRTEVTVDEVKAIAAEAERYGMEPLLAATATAQPTVSRQAVSAASLRGAVMAGSPKVGTVGRTGGFRSGRSNRPNAVRSSRGAVTMPVCTRDLTSIDRNRMTVAPSNRHEQRDHRLFRDGRSRCGSGAPVPGKR